MIKEINYTGYTTNPSDYECSDGDLAVSIGLIQENGALRPIFQPAVVMNLNTGDKLLYIHHTSNYTNYIIINGTRLFFRTVDGGISVDVDIKTPFDKEIYQVISVGNTLVILTSDGVEYALFATSDKEYYINNNDKDSFKDKYIYLGSQLPELPFQFMLKAHINYESVGMIQFNPNNQENYNYPDADDYVLTEQQGKLVTDKVFASLNKLVADEVSVGRFCHPFLVRYAYRLYDGSLICHSVPCYMECSNPDVFFAASVTNANEFVAAFTQLSLFTFDLGIRYAASNDARDFRTKFGLWTDIIKSIDFFVSAPLYRYDINGVFKQFKTLSQEKGQNYFIGSCTEMNDYSYHSLHFTHDILEAYNNENLINFKFILPHKDNFEEDVRNCSNFYFLKSLPLEDLFNNDNPYYEEYLTIEKDYLSSLVTREVMTDDFDSHDTIIAQKAYQYNSRLNLINLKKKVNCFFPSYSFIQHIDTGGGFSGNRRIKRIIYEIEHGDIVKIVNDNSDTYMPIAPKYIYVPNTSVNSIVFQVEDLDYNIITQIKIDLRPHDFLNGSVFFSNLFLEEPLEPEVSYTENNTGIIKDISNKIYTSEVNNPFNFQVLGINTIGIGKILGVSTAAKALSEGQFGQFPLYAFTTEGVWALEVSATGTFSAKQPITRDVCVNPDSITQLDSAVLFATDRGIMLLSGSDTFCITDSIKSDDLFNINQLSKYQVLLNEYDSTVSLTDVTMPALTDYLINCGIIYDYANQHVIVYNSNYRYAYVYSLKSKLWGMTKSNIVYNIASYPNALAVTEDYKLVDYSKRILTGIIDTLVITRPFKLGDANAFKTIDAIIQRGDFRSNHICQVLYASNDLVHWHIVWSSVDSIMRGFRGTPYKYFRLALISHFDKSESIYGCTVSFDYRLANQIR